MANIGVLVIVTVEITMESNASKYRIYHVVLTPRKLGSLENTKLNVLPLPETGNLVPDVIADFVPMQNSISLSSMRLEFNLSHDMAA